MYPWQPCAATWLISASLLLVPLAAAADEDLPAKREACQTEARQQIKPRRVLDPGLYEITVQARQNYVRKCMARAPEDWLTIGSTRWKAAPPLPPPRPTGALEK